MKTDTPTKQPQNLGFDEAFDDVKPEQWTPSADSVSNDPPIPTDHLKRVAEQTGFPSRQTPTPKEPMDQINFRAKASTIATFRALCAAQEPSWPYGYGFERAIAALQRDLDAGQKAHVDN